MSLGFRLWVWTGRIRFRITMLRAHLRGLPRRVRRLLGLPRRKRVARILFDPERGSWRVCPSGLSREGFGVDQVEDEIALPATSQPGEVVAALRAALAGSRYLDAPAQPMSDRQWRDLFGNHLMVSALEERGRLHLQGQERIRSGSYYKPIEGVDGTVATGASPQAIFETLRDLIDRIERHEAG